MRIVNYMCCVLAGDLRQCEYATWHRFWYRNDLNGALAKERFTHIQDTALLIRVWLAWRYYDRAVRDGTISWVEIENLRVSLANYRQTPGHQPTGAQQDD